MDCESETNPASTPEPMPAAGKQTVLPHVMKDLADRAIFGEKKYFTLLQTGNGRDALLDLYQELLDGVMYTKQELLQRDERAKLMGLHDTLCKMSIKKQLKLGIKFLKENSSREDQQVIGLIMILENALLSFT